MDIITQADTMDAFLPLRSDLDRLSYAYYFSELVDRFTEEGEEHYAVFDLIQRGFHWLEKTDQLARTARYFELRLLDALGYRPQLHSCVNCGEELLPEENFLTPEGGGMLNAKCRNSYRDVAAVTVNVLKVLRFLNTRGYDEVEKLRLTPQVEGEVEYLLHYYLTHWLERNLKSIDFLNTLRSNLVNPITLEPQ